MDNDRQGSGVGGAISFPAGNDDFRAVRNACARACRIFNDTPEDADPEVRCRNWLDIVQPDRTDPTDPTGGPAVTLSETFRDPTLRAAAPFVKPPVHVDYGLRVRVGATTFINRHCTILDTPVADVVIGERCHVGPHCSILAVAHPLGRAGREHGRTSTGRAVRVGDGVWIGAGVTIMGGVTIGDGAVIGACSLVTHDIPPRTLAFGIPAVVRRELQEHEADDETAGHAETLEEALELASDEPDREVVAQQQQEQQQPPLVVKTDPVVVVASPWRRPSLLLAGGRESRMTRAEVLSYVALAMSLLSSLMVAALLVNTKRMVFVVE